MGMRTKHKSSKVGDRVIATQKLGSIRQGDAGKVVKILPFHSWTNPDLRRRVVRFDELPHDYVVSDDDLAQEPNEKPHDDAIADKQRYAEAQRKMQERIDVGLPEPVYQKMVHRGGVWVME